MVMCTSGRSLFAALALLLGTGLALCAPAVETKPAPLPNPVLKEGELKSRLKALVSESLKLGDLWTAIQADAYATQKLGVRSAGLLGSSEVLGDPLFAFPAHIAGQHQRGEQVIVIAGQRLYRLASDGRPLAVSQPIPFVPHATAVTNDGVFVALVERTRTPAWALKVLVRNLTTGSEVFSATLPLIASDYIHGDIHIAPDGSAVMVGVLNDNGNAGPRTAVMRAGGKHVAVPGFYRPVAIAADGVWGIAEPASNIGGDDRHYALLHGGTSLLCRSVAVGTGVAALIAVEDRANVQVIAGDGKRSTLRLPRALGTSPRVLSAGEWLVVASGWPKQDEAEVDLLGNPVTSAGEQFTSWFYRWSDVATDATRAQPLLSVPGVPGGSTLAATTVFVGGDDAVQVVDLTQPKPVANLLMTPAGPVRYVETRHGRVLLWLREGKFQIIDESGADLWNGVAGNGVVIHDPWYASTYQEDGTITWVRLAALPAERLSTRLSLPAGGGFELELDRYHRHLLAVRTRADWMEFDPSTGKALKGAGIRPLRPQVVAPGAGSAISAFTVQWARLLPRLATPVVEDPSSRWNPLDAWRVNGTLVVLDHHGQVHVAGRKRGSYQTLGSVDYPAMFAQTAMGDLMITSEENVGRARLAAGPILATEGQGIGQPAQPLLEGPWRVKNLFFMPPRAGSFMWDASRCGFTPARLRSPPPPATGMLVITDSLVFDLDPAVGKQFGVLDKAGLRDAEE
jgi:hypothetical protein